MKTKFNYNALPMLVAALTVCENFVANMAALVAEQPQWADPYIVDFKKAVEAFLKEYFGISSKAQVKEATRLVVSLQAKAAKDLGMIKTQITRNFRTDKARKGVILETLGYTLHWKKAGNGNQTELIALLYAFANNLTTALRTELEGKNVNAARITNVLGFKDTLSAANITQESLKGSSKLQTEAAIKALNAIYDQAMDICDIAKPLFVADKTRRDLFVFSKLVQQQGDDGPDDKGGDTGPGEKGSGGAGKAA